MNKLKHRKRNRLKNYDYSQNGNYFITICTKDRINYFGEIIDGEMILNKYGKIANKYWMEIPLHYKNIFIDEFIIMPNHIHGIIIIDRNRYEIEGEIGVERNRIGRIGEKIGEKIGVEQCSTPTVPEDSTPTVSQVIKSFKEACTKYYHKKYNNYEFAWQRSFYDIIVRNEKAFLNIGSYIKNNPIKWQLDRDNN